MTDYRIFADYHTHTSYSHGKGSPRENVLAAIEKGLDRIAVSEHGPGHFSFGVRGKKLAKLNGELTELKKEFEDKIEVLRGLELNVMGFGKSDCPADRDDYDVIIIGYHKSVPPFNAYARRIWGESLFGVKNDPHMNAECILAAAESCRANIISHPNLYLKVDIPYMAECCRQLGIMMEVNSARVTMSEEEIRTVKKLGCSLVIGSDAHTPSRVGDFKLASDAVTEANAWDAVKNARPII
ncbi:MAG: PHP domain-containing protein [Clostridiales bacterium]|nr:PHP domain-containing protein [Clostridiales bacterium]